MNLEKGDGMSICIEEGTYGRTIHKLCDEIDRLTAQLYSEKSCYRYKKELVADLTKEIDRLKARNKELNSFGDYHNTTRKNITKMYVKLEKRIRGLKAENKQLKEELKA